MDDAVIVALISAAGSIIVAFIAISNPKEHQKTATMIDVPRKVYDKLIEENLQLQEENRNLKKELEKYENH